MRKADYAALATVIQKKRADALRAKNGMSERQDFVAMCIEQTARDIAEDFSRIASVNRWEFLKACSIE